MKSFVTKSKDKSPQKLLGVELFRGVAVFAVVLVHSGDGTWGEMSRGVEYLRTFFAFHVPFFLAASFHFSSQKALYGKNNSYSTSEIMKRSQRILSPYIKWTLVYLAFRCLFFLLIKEYESIAKLLNDPISIVFLGGASYHLYFLPLLLCGTLFFYFLDEFVASWSPLKGFIVFLIGILANFALSATGNQFQLGPNIAFEELFKSWSMEPADIIILRLISVLSAWVITCLPYIGAAIALNCIAIFNSADSEHLKKVNPLPAIIRSRHFLLALCSFIFLASTFLIDSSSPWRSFQKVTIAFALLTIAILISKHLPVNESLLSRVAIGLGKCALGIYLIHPIFIRIVRLGLSYSFPRLLEDVSVPSVLLISSISFSVSWLAVNSIMKSKILIRCLA